MKKLLITTIFLICASFNVNAKNLINYSILIEEDFDTIMLIQRYSDNTTSGKIISYGGYKYFKDVYGNGVASNMSTYIQPAYHGIGSNMESYMKPKYIIDKFNFKFSIRGNDYILNFISPEAFQNIEGYITRKESFSIATLKPSVAWYGGTFTPLKSIKDLKVISKNNSLTLCKILLEPEVIDLKNRETNTNIIKFLACDNNETNTGDRDDDFEENYFALNWYNLDNSKNHNTEIPTSNSTVNILESEIYLKGEKDINEYSVLVFETEDHTQDMFIKGESYSIYIDYINEGYTSLEDWNDVDPKKLLEDMKSTAKEDVKTVTWLIEPKIFKNTNVTYSYKVEWNDGDITIETKILTLGRKGHNDISLVASQENFSVTELENLAIEFAKTIKFADGFAYADYKSGDKVAALGIGGLVAGTLGIKALAKVGVLAKLLPFLKGFWWIILAPMLIIGKLFSGNSDNSQKTTSPKKNINRRKKKD